MNDEEILALRADGWQPKNIAKKLGLRPAAVEAVLRDVATQEQAEREARGELPELLECLTDSLCLRWLFENKRKDNNFDPMERELLGLSHVMVARMDRGKYIYSNFMIDYWCLGVKDAIPMRKSDIIEYKKIKSGLFSPYGGPQQITLEQAQSMVYGAIEYAQKLGFEPHPDGIEALKLLGPRPKKLLPLKFGKNGKPLFINGPHDDVFGILDTLNTSVGKGKYHFGVQVPSLSHDD